MSNSNSPTLVLRSGRWLPIACWVVLGILIGEPIVRDQWGVVVNFGPGVLLAAWLVYLLFWQPRVEVGTDSVKVVNVWSVTEVGLGLVTDIGTSGLLSVHYKVHDIAKRVSAWGVTGRRPSAMRQHPHPGRTTGSTDSAHKAQLAAALRDEQGAPGVARARWLEYTGNSAKGKVAELTPNWPALIGSVLFGGLALLSWLV